MSGLIVSVKPLIVRSQVTQQVIYKYALPASASLRSAPSDILHRGCHGFTVPYDSTILNKSVFLIFIKCNHYSISSKANSQQLFFPYNPYEPYDKQMRRIKHVKHVFQIPSSALSVVHIYRDERQQCIQLSHAKAEYICKSTYYDHLDILSETEIRQFYSRSCTCRQLSPTLFIAPIKYDYDSHSRHSIVKPQKFRQKCCGQRNLAPPPSKRSSALHTIYDKQSSCQCKEYVLCSKIPQPVMYRQIKRDL